MNNLKDKEKDTNEKKTETTQDELSWAESAKEDLEEFIESQGVYLRQ